MPSTATASLAEEFAHLLHVTAHDWRTALDRRLRPLGLSRATWMLLAYVRKLDAPSQTVLADRLGLEGPSVVRLVDRLEREGLVERRSAADRRVRTIHLTAKGEALSAEIHRAAAAMRGELFAGIGEAELEAARSVLQRLHARLAAPASPARPPAGADRDSGATIGTAESGR
ncbi:MAG: MarR family transcriptional regulator [Burkholderiales bacterium]